MLIQQVIDTKYKVGQLYIVTTWKVLDIPVYIKTAKANIVPWIMYRTLSELRNSINQLIEQQGENAPCAAFVFTKNDVFYYEMDEDGFEKLNEEKSLSDDDTDDVLTELGRCDYIYEQVGEVIDDEVRRVRNKVSNW